MSDLNTHLNEAVAEIARLRATLKAVCEDAFSDECPTDGKCDTYGHEEECGAVSAAAHAKNLREENKRLKESEVTAIKIGLDLDERNQVLESRLAQAREILQRGGDPFLALRALDA